MDGMAKLPMFDQIVYDIKLVNTDKEHRDKSLFLQRHKRLCEFIGLLDH